MRACGYNNGRRQALRRNPVTAIQMPPTNLAISDDRTRGNVQIGSENLILDATALENLIGHLGALRAQLQPPVAPDPPLDGTFLQINAPIVEVTRTPDGESVGLLVRTPTYGWIGCAFRTADARKIGEYLTAIPQPAA
jgi:hypothetical protein